MAKGSKLLLYVNHVYTLTAVCSEVRARIGNHARPIDRKLKLTRQPDLIKRDVLKEVRANFGVSGIPIKTTRVAGNFEK